MFVFFENWAMPRQVASHATGSFLPVKWLKVLRAGFISAHTTGSIIVCLFYSAIKCSYFYCCKRQLLAEMSFAQLLTQFGGTRPVKPRGKLATKAPQSSWVEFVWQGITRHGHRVRPVSHGNSAISSQFHSCVQLVAATMISLITIMQVYFAKCFFNRLGMCKCSLSLLDSEFIKVFQKIRPTRQLVVASWIWLYYSLRSMMRSCFELIW